jgi:hypothetical protein
MISITRHLSNSRTTTLLRHASVNWVSLFYIDIVPGGGYLGGTPAGGLPRGSSILLAGVPSDRARDFRKHLKSKHSRHFWRLTPHTTRKIMEKLWLIIMEQIINNNRTPHAVLTTADTGGSN